VPPPWAQVVVPRVAPPPQHPTEPLAADTQLQNRVDRIEAQIPEMGMRLAEKDMKLQEMLANSESCRRELAKVRYDYDCAVADKEQLEEAKNTGFAQRDAALEKLRERVAEAERELQAQVQANCGQAESSERELNWLRPVADAARRLEGEKRTVEAELDKVREQLRKVTEEARKASEQQHKAEQERNDLRCRLAVAEDKAEGARLKLRDVEQEAQRWQQERTLVEKEKAAAQKRLDEVQREQLLLESRLRQEKTLAKVVTPGDYLRMMKANEKESLSKEHSQLKRELAKTTCDLELCIAKIRDQERELQQLGGPRRCRAAA